MVQNYSLRDTDEEREAVSSVAMDACMAIANVNFPGHRDGSLHYYQGTGMVA